MERDGRIKPFLTRDGQSRSGRYPLALDPSYAEVDGRSTADLIAFAAKYAGQLRFYDTDASQPTGTWSSFPDGAADAMALQPARNGDLAPHVALYVSFLMVLQHARSAMNALTARHLEFYLKRVLGLVERGPVPDRAHVVFQLKKGAADELITAGTLLKAGKDRTGKDLLYATAADLTVRSTRVQDLRSLFRERSRKGALHAAWKADSGDGQGAPLNPQDPSWLAFGHSQLPIPRIGFAFASALLLLKEGVRRVRAYLRLEGVPKSLTLSGVLAVYFTGAKGWIGPVIASLSPAVGDGEFMVEANLTSGAGEVVAYEPRLHGPGFETDQPVMKVLLAEELGYGESGLAKAVVKRVRLEVEVEGIATGLVLESDVGPLDPSKPFMPFGPRPDVGSHLFIGCDEALSKKLERFSLTVRWKVPDANLSHYYSGYTEATDGGTRQLVSSNEGFRAFLTTHDGGSWKVCLFKKEDASLPVTFPEETGRAKAQRQDKEELIASRLALQQNRWALAKGRALDLARAGWRGDLKKGGSKIGLARGAGRNAFATMTLASGFYHAEYRELLKQAAVDAASSRNADVAIPREPYIPVILSLRLGYRSATDSVDPNNADEKQFLSDEVEFFHIAPFGQSREHAFLKEKLGFAADRAVTLLPRYDGEGEFYIGLPGVKAREQLPLFFQVQEGTANPEKDPVAVDWSVLSDNHWKSFGANGLLADTTDGLLTSGIITLVMPEEATDKNTLLPAGLFWLRAQVGQDTDAVCRILDVRSNATVAIFQDRENDPSHLAAPMPPDSIAKLVVPQGGIKSVEQPYASFGGRVREDSRSFSCRVSERLRHKDRSVAIWDYERMILEQFPEIYKVKCLNHTSPSSLLAPGHVTLLVVPDIRNGHYPNPFMPRAAKHTLVEIAEFLKGHAGLFVQVHVENPLFEEVRLGFGVAFRKGLEFGRYRARLDLDIQRFLSPWAFEEGTDMLFGGKQHKSVLIRFVEERQYVDYVTDVRLRVGSGGSWSGDTETVTASNERAVLVSAAGHDIEPAASEGP